MNILFIGVPNSIHDRKWMAYLAKTNNVYSITEITSQPFIDDSIKEDLVDKKVVQLDYLNTYSFSKPYKLLKSISYLKKIIRDYKIDIVHVLFASPYCLWLNHISVPCIITTRGTDVLKIIPGLKSNPSIKNKILFKKVSKAFRKAAFITSTSSKQLESIKELFNVDANIIRTGVDVEGIENVNVEENIIQPLKHKDKIIFFPRFISPIYNLQLQIDALKLLPKSILKEYTFVFIKGLNKSPKERVYHEDIIPQIKSVLGDNLVLLNGISQLEMYAIYQKSSLAIMTPISDGTPNSALESMSARCPLIIGNCDYDQDIFKDTCLKLEEYTAEKLSDLIQFALAEYPNELLENGYKSVSNKGNIPNEMNKLVALYQKIIKP